jgi:hypothetical protein
MFKNFHCLFVNAIGTILNVGVEFGFSDRVGSASRSFSYLDFSQHMSLLFVYQQHLMLLISKKEKKTYINIYQNRKKLMDAVLHISETTVLVFAVLLAAV